jgi:two-component system OmpR family response regulator
MAAILSCKIELAADFARSSLYPAARTPEREDVTAEPHILIVDDDAEICALVRQFLEPHNFRVTAAFDGPSMRAVRAKEPADLVILDLMLPGDDGLTLCRELRANSHIPIIFLTAVNSEADRVAGLELGADDYLSKPFSTRELLARVRAVLRRASPAPNELSQQVLTTAQARRLRFSGWTLDTGRRQLTDPDGVLVDLSGGEYELLVALLERPNIVLNRDQLLDITRGRYAGPFDRAIDMQVGRLRRKIEADPKNPVLIKTVRSGGYVLASPVEQR